MAGSKVTVTNASTLMIAASQRRGFSVTNPSTATETLYVNLGAAAVVGEGQPLAPGQSLTPSYDGEFNMPPTQFDSYTLDVFGIYASESNSVPTLTF